MKFVTLGIDHRHAFGMTEKLIAAGAECIGFWTEGSPETLPGWVKRFPGIPRLVSFQAGLETDCAFVVLSGIPADRADQAIAAMQAGKDVMTDKPGCTTPQQLEALRTCVEQTGRIWSVDFSERFEVPSVTMATELVEQGAIGRVIQTVGLGPHRLNAATRPGWFFDRARYGGILTDIASHQIDQFLHFTGSDSARIVMAHVANRAHPQWPGLQDFGEICLRTPDASGYIRVDWFTPDALPTWGDGRLTILGTQGYIELRKYVDIGHQGTDHLLLVNGSTCERIDASRAPLPYFPRFLSDVENRTDSAMPQAHAFTVMALALQAQTMAEAAS